MNNYVKMYHKIENTKNYKWPQFNWLALVIWTGPKNLSPISDRMYLQQGEL